MISFVWTASFICSIPILLVQQLQPIPTGNCTIYPLKNCILFSVFPGHKCREQWPSNGSEQMYNLFLNVILFLLPLTIMSSAYFMIVEKLWKGLQREMEHSSCQKLGKYCHFGYYLSKEVREKPLEINELDKFKWHVSVCTVSHKVPISGHVTNRRTHLTDWLDTCHLRSDWFLITESYRGHMTFGWMKSKNGSNIVTAICTLLL